MRDQSSKEDTDPSKIVATNGPITLAISPPQREEESKHKVARKL